MNFNLTKEQQMVRRMAREFAVNEVEPIASEIDEEARYPIETIEKAGKLGVMGMPFPERIWRSRLDYVTYVMAIEEMSKVDASME
jgi:butyryl-CoA dehydrogenase